MIRKFKTLGIAMVAVLALSAVVASAASATHFTASSYPTGAAATSALGNDDFKIEGGSITCHGTFTAASIAEPVAWVTVTPVYTSCTAFSLFNATVAMNGCDYMVYANGVVDVECPAGKTILIVAGPCEATIGTKTGLKSVKLTNSGNHIDAQANVSGIPYTVTKDAFGCPFAGLGTKTGGTYTQKAAVTVIPDKAPSIDIG